MAVVRDKFPVLDSLVPVRETITPGDLTSKTTPVVLTLLHILDTILIHCILHILGTILVHCLI